MDPFGACLTHGRVRTAPPVCSSMSGMQLHPGSGLVDIFAGIITLIALRVPEGFFGNN